MPSSFQLTEDAIRDLEQTMDYLSQRSVTAAARLADNLERAFLFLAEWPGAGSRSAEFSHHPVRFWTTGEYNIAYLPETKPLVIVAVTHGSRDAAAEIDFRLHHP